MSLGIFSGELPTEPCALGSTQPLKMSIRNSPGGEGGRCVELTTNCPSSAERQEIRGLNLPGPPRAPGGLLREYLYLSSQETFSVFCATEFATCFSQQPVTFPEPRESSQILATSLFKINLNIVLSCTLISRQ
jgi:hypothetical protein